VLPSAGLYVSTISTLAKVYFVEGGVVLASALNPQGALGVTCQNRQKVFFY
jgi:hypothetical protein